MISRPLALGVLVAGCLTAAAGGSYVAVRQNARASAQPVSAPTPAHAVTPTVTESEGVVTPAEPARTAPAAVPAPRITPVEPARTPGAVPPTRATPVEAGPKAPAGRRVFPRVPPPNRASERTAPQPAATNLPPPAEVRPPMTGGVPAGASAESLRMPERPAVETATVAETPARPPEPTFEEIVIPASSVIGLELETSLTSERAQLEDRVDARVTRDVYADGRMAIPAGSRVIGAVTLVERGGKMKERARLGVRFHTLVLANNRQVPLRTETIYREGASPSSESSRKIGGAAVGGAVLGAILGGGKGAIAGATAGAAGGTAAVMAGGRNAATLASGSILTVKLAAPASLDVER
jgi:hypothetical protein